jgi:PBP1b-binding outer membrane lipoprotein LpoB
MKMKRFTTIILIALFLVSGCASTKMFEYADKKADELLKENTQLKADLVVKDEQITLQQTFIDNTRAALIRAKPSFPESYIIFFNNLKWKIGDYVPPLQPVQSDTTKGEKK